MKFQNNINVVHKWSVDWKVPMYSYCLRKPIMDAYKLRETVMNWADTTTYLGVTMQSNFKFDQHVALKKNKASTTRRTVSGLY